MCCAARVNRHGLVFVLEHVLCLSPLGCQVCLDFVLGETCRFSVPLSAIHHRDRFARACMRCSTMTLIVVVVVVLLNVLGCWLTY